MARNSKSSTAKRVPVLCHCNGRGYVKLNGQRIYLGPWGSPETDEAYARTITEWLANGRRLYVRPDEISVSEVILAYWEHCKEYYRRPDGSLTSQISRVKCAVRPLRKLYGSTRAAEFGPNALRALREVWLDEDLARKTINDYTGVIKGLFKWAASHELVPVTAYQSLATVENLRVGRSRARERERVTVVPEAHIAAIEPYVSRQVWALVQLQLLTGARGSELLKLRAIDIDTSGEVWSVTLKQHKTAHHGKQRVIPFGPKARAILKEFMGERPVDACLFSPRAGEQERHARAETHRRPDQKPNRRKTSREVGDHYRTDTYRAAIERGCDYAGVPRWTPHRLRHTAATRVRKEFGLEAAQAILGHSRADVTEIYAELDLARATDVAKKMG